MPTPALSFARRPERIAALADPDALHAALELARAVCQGPVALRLVGAPQPFGDVDALPLVEARDPAAEATPDERVGWLSLPLSDAGPAARFGVFVARPAGELPAGFVEHLAQQLVTAARLGAADLDPATELLNPAGLARRAPAWAARVAASKVVLAVDLEQLRFTNRRAGRAAGDARLERAASSLAVQAQIHGGLAARLGGDDLLLAVPGDEPRGRDLARELLALRRPGEALSVGLAAGDADLAALRARAELALDAVKATGGGGVEAWRPELAPPTASRAIALEEWRIRPVLETLHDVATCADAQETLRTIAERCRTVTRAERCLVVFQAARGAWEVRVAVGSDTRSAFVESVARQALEERRATFAITDGQDAISPSADRLQIKAVMAAPLEAPSEDGPRGVLYVDSAAARSGFSAETLPIFDALAAGAALTLQAARRVEDLSARASSLERSLARREDVLGRVLRGGRVGADAASVEELVGRSPAIQRLKSMLPVLAESEAPVLVRGESGTGKELVARAIHAGSSRAAGPFVAVNCAALASQVVESELFGHVRGSFTGAFADRVGLVEAAHEGTLFLDEVGELEVGVQAKLLRVLQEGTFRPVGSGDERAVDVRVVAATHRDLPAMCQEGAFREDLYFRLAVLNLQVPPLRERVGDVPLLIAHLLAQLPGPARGVTADALRELVAQPWRGNVRELKNALERACALAGEVEVLGREHFELGASSPRPGKLAAGLTELPFTEAKFAFARRYAQEVVERLGSIAAAVEFSGASRTTLYRLLREAEELEGGA
ncbi:MAG: sigma 54-interacting transcriptional regulator [Planctomycetota bacterium]